MRKPRKPNDGPGTVRARMFKFIVEYKIAHDGCAPSYLDITSAVFIARSTVRYHMLHLERLDMIVEVVGSRKSRMIEIVGGYMKAKENWPEYFEGEQHGKQQQNW